MSFNQESNFFYYADVRKSWNQLSIIFIGRFKRPILKKNLGFRLNKKKKKLKLNYFFLNWNDDCPGKRISFT